MTGSKDYNDIIYFVLITKEDTKGMYNKKLDEYLVGTYSDVLSCTRKMHELLDELRQRHNNGIKINTNKTIHPFENIFHNADKEEKHTFKIVWCLPGRHIEGQNQTFDVNQFNDIIFYNACPFTFTKIDTQ